MYTVVLPLAHFISFASYLYASNAKKKYYSIDSRQDMEKKICTRNQIRKYHTWRIKLRGANDIAY